MFLPSEGTLPTHIIQSLEKGGLTGPELCRYMKGYTRQAIYSALRALLKKEVIYKVKKLYSINKTWIRELHAFAESQLEDIQSKDVAYLQNLEDGDRITFRFKNPHLMNVYWDNIFNALLEVRKNKNPIIIYHPHEWFIHARPRTEALFLTEFSKKEYMTLIAIGGGTLHDRNFQKQWRGKYMQVNCGKNYGFDNGYYLNIMDDFMFEVFFDKSFSQGLEKIFNEAPHPLFDEKVEEFVNRDWKIKLVVSRNKKKARKLFQRISRDFVITKSKD